MRSVLCIVFCIVYCTHRCACIPTVNRPFADSVVRSLSARLSLLDWSLSACTDHTAPTTPLQPNRTRPVTSGFGSSYDRGEQGITRLGVATVVTAAHQRSLCLCPARDRSTATPTRARTPLAPYHPYTEWYQPGRRIRRGTRSACRRSAVGVDVRTATSRPQQQKARRGRLSRGSKYTHGRCCHRAGRTAVQFGGT